MNLFDMDGHLTHTRPVCLAKLNDKIDPISLRDISEFDTFSCQKTFPIG